MKVLLVTDSFPPRCGGSGHSVHALARALGDAGADVRVLHRAAGEPIARGALGVLGVAGAQLTVPELRAPVVRDLHRAWVRDRALEGAIGDAIAEERPDVIHAQQGSNFAPVLRAARRASVAAVATVRDYAPICLRTTRFNCGAICPGCSAARLAACFADRYGGAPWAFAPLVPLGLAATRRRTRVLSGFARVIAVSGYVRDRLIESGVSAPIEVVSNVPPAPPEPPARPAAASGFEYVLFAGKLNAEKGADLLAGIAAALPSGTRLVVLGDGPLAPALDRAAAVGAPIERRGDLANDEVLGWIAHARALVLPSRWPEPLSRLLLEAGAFAVPVVALATGGTAERIRDGENGLLAADPAELPARVAALAANGALRARLAEGARRHAAADGSRIAIVGEMLTVYRAAAS